MKSEEPFLEYKRKLKACNGNVDCMVSVFIEARFDPRLNRYEFFTLKGFAKDLEEPQ